MVKLLLLLTPSKGIEQRPHSIHDCMPLLHRRALFIRRVLLQKGLRLDPSRRRRTSRNNVIYLTFPLQEMEGRWFREDNHISSNLW